MVNLIDKANSYVEFLGKNFEKETNGDNEW